MVIREANKDKPEVKGKEDKDSKGIERFCQINKVNTCTRTDNRTDIE